MHRSVYVDITTKNLAVADLQDHGLAAVVGPTLSSSAVVQVAGVARLRLRFRANRAGVLDFYALRKNGEAFARYPTIVNAQVVTVADVEDIVTIDPWLGEAAIEIEFTNSDPTQDAVPDICDLCVI